MLTSDQIASIRTWISDRTPPTDIELDPIYTRTGSLKGVVEAVLRKRLADLQARPAQFAVAGDYSQSTSANIASLQKQLETLSGYDDNLAKIVSTHVPTVLVVVITTHFDPCRGHAIYGPQK